MDSTRCGIRSPAWCAVFSCHFLGISVGSMLFGTCEETIQDVRIPTAIDQTKVGSRSNRNEWDVMGFMDIKPLVLVAHQK